MEKGRTWVTGRWREATIRRGKGNWLAKESELCRAGKGIIKVTRRG